MRRKSYGGFAAVISIAVLIAWVETAAAQIPAAPQAGETVLSDLTLQGTVDAVDHAGRTVTIRGQQGNVVTLDVPTSVVRFDQVKVGGRST